MNVMRLGAKNRNTILIIIVSIGLILTGFLIGSLFDKPVHVNAQVSQEAEHKYYTSVKITSGDSLWSIAEEYRTDECGDIKEYIREIKSLNKLKTDKIHAGEYLLIPYYSEEIK